MGKATPVPKPGGVPMKASPNFTGKAGPLPAGAGLASAKKAKSDREPIPTVKPKRATENMPVAKPAPARPSTAPGKAPSSIPSKSGESPLPPGASQRYESEYQDWLKKHPKAALKGWPT